MVISSQDDKPSSVVVWTFLTAKKREKIGYERLVELASSMGTVRFEVVHPRCKEDMERMKRSIESSDERHVILHKISDYSKEEQLDDTPITLADILQEMTTFLGHLPNVRVINSMEGIGLVSDRWRTCNFFASLPIRSPRSLLTLSTIIDLNFPVLWKPVSACGHPGSHDMFFLPRHCCLERVGDLKDGIAQEFIAHGGVLYKVFVVGTTFSVDIRPSITEDDFSSENSPHPFDSQFIRQLRPLHPSTLSFARSKLEQHSHLIEETSRLIREGLGLELFGWDLIISHDGHPYIIDINNFPKFDGFPDFHKHLLHLVLQ